MPHLKVMGGLELDLGGFSQPKPLLLLAYLALEGAQRRRRLAELFWQDGNRMKSLSMALTRLRQGAGDVVVADERRAWATASSDAGDLLDALRGGAWERAVELYRGAFLDGVAFAAGSVELEEWVLATREYLAARVQHGLLELAESAARRREFARGGELAERALFLPGAGAPDPATLRRMYALLTAGDSVRAPLVRAELAELGETRRFTTEEAQSSFERSASEDPRPSATLSVLASPAQEVDPSKLPTNVPPRRTTFIGRERELRAVEEALASSSCRLVTLSGPGGVGKSRLAHEVALRALARSAYPDGVFLVTLDSERDLGRLGDLALAAIGTQLGDGTDPWQRLIEALAEARVLLVFDDVDGARAPEELANVLASTTGVDLVVTSRTRLGLQEEHAIPLTGLPLPTDKVPWHEAMTYGAVRLFVDRARRADLSANLGQQGHDAVLLCRELDGLPLALELAAPWTRLLSCAEIVRHLRSDPDFLAAVSDDVPERHRSMRRVFEASWRWLRKSERELARRLAVFRSEFTLEAAGAVASATLVTLARLIDSSLVQVRAPGRYRLHPLLAEFLRQKLAGVPDERAEVERRHDAYYLDGLEERRRQLRGGQQTEALASLRDEWAEVESVLERALLARDARTLEPFVALMDVAYEARGALLEGVEVLGRIDRSLGADAWPELRARLRIEEGWFYSRLGEHDEAWRRTSDGLTLAESLGNGAVPLLARGWANLGGLAAARGRREEGEDMLKRALALAHQVKSDQDRTPLVANALSGLGLVAAEAGRMEEAVTYFGRAVALHEDVGDVLCLIRELGNLAIGYGIQGDMGRSGEMMERCLALEREIDFRQSMPYTLSNLGVHHFRLGDLARAEALNLEALTLAEETGQRRILVGVLVNLVSVYVRAGDVPAAAAAATKALGLAAAIGLEPLQLQALTAYAEAEAAGGRDVVAARLLQVVLTNPATSSYSRGVAADLWRELEDGIGGEVAAGAATYAKMTPVTAVIARTLGRPESGVA
ncbi:MAG: tetratricopeptide repeat protein [Trueperaceae bacterium]